MALENTSAERIQALVEAQRAFYATGTTRQLSWRKAQLKAFHAGLKKWEKPLCEALWTDLHKSYEEAYLTELGLVYSEINEAICHLRKWARRRCKPTPLTGMPSASYIVREPLGCTLIVSPWNYPVQLLLNPLVGAIAAGCTAILKDSETGYTEADLQQISQMSFWLGIFPLIFSSLIFAVPLKMGVRVAVCAVPIAKMHGMAEKINKAHDAV